MPRMGKEIVGRPLINILRSGGLSQSTSLEQVIKSACADHSTPRELAAVVSKKYPFVVSVTTKSFDPESTKPSYQVHRIDVEYGKQPHSSALRRNTGVALASSSRSASSGLNYSGEALADAAILGLSSSSDTMTELSDAPTSTGLGVSGGAPWTLLPQTPPSVVKPTRIKHGISDAKNIQNSSV